MTGKMASISASLAAKVMVYSCPSMAGTFLLFVIRRCFRVCVGYCMPDTRVPASPVLTRVVGEEIDGQAILDGLHPGGGLRGDGQGAALLVVLHAAPELDDAAADDDVDAVVVDPGLGEQQVVQIVADLVVAGGCRCG